MIVFTDGGDDSGTYWFVNIDKGSADPLGKAYPTVTSKDVGPVRMIDYKAADGLDLHGVLTLPPGREARNLPLVVMPHGGPWARDYPKFDYWAQAFASRGYAVFQPNFRSSTGYGQALYEAGYGEWGRKMQTDISDGAAELARQGIVDPKRACIVGWSYGGYAAQAGVTVQHRLYRCAVSMAGVSDLAKQLKYTEDEAGIDSPAARTWSLFLGVKSDWGVLRDISPAMLASRADAPILLIHGNDDTVVPIAQSDEMEKALQAAGKPVERVTLKGADHWLLEQDTRVAMLKASVAFVQKYNPADSAPSPPAEPPAGR
jgi:dipeptidyl aminopeptidase/acylaminoacyl peptidase